MNQCNPVYLPATPGVFFTRDNKNEGSIQVPFPWNCGITTVPYALIKAGHIFLSQSSISILRRPPELSSGGREENPSLLKENTWAWHPLWSRTNFYFRPHKRRSRRRHGYTTIHHRIYLSSQWRSNWVEQPSPKMRYPIHNGSGICCRMWKCKRRCLAEAPFTRTNAGLDWNSSINVRQYVFNWSFQESQVPSVSQRTSMCVIISTVRHKKRRKKKWDTSHPNNNLLIHSRNL